MEFLEALTRLRRTASQAVRAVVAGAPLVAALLGGAPSVFAAVGSPSRLNINVNIQAIGNITDLAAVPSSTGAIALSWTEPYHSVGVAPYSYDVRASTVGQIADDVVFSTSPLLSVFSPNAPPAPGAGGGAAGFVASGLTPGVTYYFAIREKDSTTFHGSWSRTLAPARNVNNFAIPPFGPPPAPASAVFAAVSSSTATGAWAVTAGATNYQLVLSTKSTNPPTLIAGSSVTVTTGAVVAGLAPNATYYGFVLACGPGCSPYAALGSTITLAAPAVSLSTVSASSGVVTIGWLPNGNPSSTTYLVDVSTDGVSYSSTAVVATTGAVVAGLNGGTTYYFEVIAQNFAGAPSVPSSALQVVTPPGPPPAPTGAFALSASTTSLTAAWSVSAGATDYLLVASTNAVNPPSLVASSSSTASSTATVAGLAPNTTYFLFVNACGAGCSAYSAISATVTLAAPAVSLSTSAISSSTVVLAWGANGDPTGTPYQVLMSTDGVSYAPVASSTAPAATVAGLSGGVTYYFEVVASNYAGTPAAASAALQVVTPSGPTPSTPTGLTAAAGLMKATVSWAVLPSTQQGSGLGAYEVYRSTNAGFGFVRVTTTSGNFFVDSPLPPGVTVYYEIDARDVYGAVSARSSAVSALPFSLLPMEPLGVVATPSSTTVSFSWTPTTRFFDGEPFVSTGTPTADELSGYALYRSTDLCAPNFVQVSTLPLTTTSITDTNNGLNYYYRLFSFNNVGFSSNVVTVSALGEFNYLVDDCVSDMILDGTAQNALNATANGLGGDIRIQRTRRPQDTGNGVFQSVEWRAVLNGVNEVKGFSLPKPVRVILHFNEVNGKVVADTATSNGFAPLSAGAAAGSAGPNDLGVYWNNGLAFQKMYGTVDPVSQIMTVQTPNLGVYQIRAQARAVGAVFDVSGISSRVITPNGDGKNDTLIFTYDPGPNNVVPSGQIFDLRGAFVADMVPGLVPNTLTWNGYMNGLPVHSGAYIYRITGDGKTFTGSIVVAR